MQRFYTLLAAAALLAGTAAPAIAQADAQASWQQAKAAYQAGRFSQALDLAKKAAQTDPKNPEVFLLLGKAHYQLGELDDALAAWKETLALAPAEPYATKMLEVLRGQRAGADVRIRLVESLIQEKLFGPGQEESTLLLKVRSLSEPQRARVMTLQAEIAVQTGHAADAQKLLREVLVLYPQQADPVQTALLLGQAKLREGAEATAEGLAVLKKLIAEHPGTPAAATARYELVAFDLKQGVDAARIDALAQWIADNPKHVLSADARRQLLDTYLAATTQGAKPGPDADLSRRT